MNSFTIKICSLKFLNMVTITDSLFLFFLFSSVSQLPHQEATITYLICCSNVRRMSTIASNKGNFLLDTPTGRTLCPVGSICAYSVMQDEGQLCHWWLIFTTGMVNIYIWVLTINSPAEAGSIHSIFCTHYVLWGYDRIFSIIL